MQPLYAHSLKAIASSEWETLGDHLTAVAARARAFGAAFGWGAVAGISGKLHDAGKASEAFQGYLHGGAARGPDHSTAGAREAAGHYSGPVGRCLAAAIAGHHAGLPDAADLKRRLDPAHPIEPYGRWREAIGNLPPRSDLKPDHPLAPSAPAGFREQFLCRMLFSCLVDADFLETEAFYARAEGAEPPRGGHPELAELLPPVRGFLAGMMAAADDTPVNALRREVLEHVTTKAALPPGVFTLTVPTGGGKTLASLRFALEHAKRHGLRRVIYVIPFTSIIEQTAAVFREAVGPAYAAAILEHHASFDWSGEGSSDDEGRSGLRKLRLAAENWDMPIVVTTAVQFFESLFANRPSRCRKLHHLAGAAIVLDEAQTIPLPVLRPCVSALDELARNYGSSVVLCTATQPALRAGDGFRHGFAIDEHRELAPEPQRLYALLKRVRVEVLAEPIEDVVIAGRFAETPRMLCIVNSRRHARALFDTIRHLAGAVHLSTLMVPKHRQCVLAEVRQRLAAEAPVRLVATSLVEAGVDIDLPEVWRAATGLDSIAQAAGRCNRNGKLGLGRVVVFTPAAYKAPREVADFIQAARPVFRQHTDDPLSLTAIEAYFREVYWKHDGAGPRDGLDRLTIGERKTGVLLEAASAGPDIRFPFQSVGEAFRLIEDRMQPVIVPWDDTARILLKEIATMDRPATNHLRRLQSYTVGVPPAARANWLAKGALRHVHAKLGDDLLAFESDAHYRPETGVDLAEPELWNAERGIV